MKTFVVSLVVVLMCVAAPAGAENRTWNDGNGLFVAGENWDPEGVPTLEDDLIIDRSGRIITGGELGVDAQFNTLTFRDGTFSGFSYMGFAHHDTVFLEGGTMNLQWFQVGRNFDATWIQTGGTASTTGNLWLGEGAFTGVGTYEMSGGTLLATDILNNTEAEGSSFSFSGGTIVLHGDAEGFDAEHEWFHVTGPLAEFYTEVAGANNRTTLSIPEAVPVGNVSESGGNTLVFEAGETTDTFTVVLTVEPNVPVTITVDPETDDVSLNAEAPNDAITLTFGTDDWDTPQTVTVQAVDDDDEEGLETVEVSLFVSTTDEAFEFGVIPSVGVVVVDDEAASVFTSKANLEVKEGDPAGDTYTVGLIAQPAADVIVQVGAPGLDPADPNFPNPLSQITVNGADRLTLTFTSGDWETPQAVTVLAIDDEVLETDPHFATIAYLVDSDDPIYDASLVPNTVVSILEDECGAWGYAPTDYNFDCEVNIVDFAGLAEYYLTCSMPNVEACTQY